MTKTIHSLFKTTDNTAALIARVALGMVMLPHGAQKGEGIEYHLLALALALIVILYGGGKASVDGVIARRSETATA